MTKPVIKKLLLATIMTSTDRLSVEESVWIWGELPDGIFRLTPLGIINTGLTKLGLVLAMDQ